MQEEQSLHKKYDALKELNAEAFKSIPQDIIKALKHPLRPYQEEAVKRFIYHREKYKNNANHTLTEMATGSGKTLTMACIMLYLYKQGYRKFIFFVNSTTILEKTKANFAESSSSKYLFASNIELDGKRVNINTVSNLDEANDYDLNIIFTTIQGLHTALENTKENSVTLEDIQNHKVVLLADEAHHLNTQTKQLQIKLESSWEETVQNILKANNKNILLEVTATAETETKAIALKYQDKLIYKYSLKEFTKDGYSKKIAMLVHRGKNKHRMLLGLLTSYFRQELASGLGNINIKPIILFKSSTIKESKDNQEDLLQILDNLTISDIEEVLNIAKNQQHNSPLLRDIFSFITENKITSQEIVSKFKTSFNKEFVVNVNDDKEKEELQLQLNSLEDENNKIRVIFAVNKLNEGWDVLNLYDIVKLFKTKNAKNTTQEAQLIGRGARLLPFCITEEQQDFKDKRKYDKDGKNLLKYLEYMHFHSADEVDFIARLQQELQEQGLLTEETLKEVDVELKEEFKETKLYKEGVIFVNEKKLRKSIRDNLDNKTQGNQFLFTDDDYFLNISNAVKDINISYDINKKVLEADTDDEQKVKQITSTQFKHHKTLKIKNIPFYLFVQALSGNEFFEFNKLRYILNIESIKELYQAMAYCTITFLSDVKQVEISTKHIIHGLSNMLDKLQSNLLVSEYFGTKEFIAKPVKEVFKTKTIIIPISQEVVETSEYENYAQKSLVGTNQEKELMQSIQGYIRQLNGIKYAYLLRSEMHFRLYNFKDGKGFAPDFVLFLQKENNELLSYQLFLEPKGSHLKEVDSWKQGFLEEVSNIYGNNKPIEIHNSKNSRKIFGLPFYNTGDEKEFRDKLDEYLKANTKT